MANENPSELGMNFESHQNQRLEVGKSDSRQALIDDMWSAPLTDHLKPWQASLIRPVETAALTTIALCLHSEGADNAYYKAFGKLPRKHDFSQVEANYLKRNIAHTLGGVALGEVGKTAVDFLPRYRDESSSMRTVLLDAAGGLVLASRANWLIKGGVMSGVHLIAKEWDHQSRNR